MTLVATKEAACLITNKIKLEGHLKGRVPDTFNGDQTKAQNFLNQFNLFWLMNDDAATMTNPFKRCIYFLGLVHGPCIEDWVIDQVSVLKEVMTWDDNQIPKTSERLWNDLKGSFELSFSHTRKVEQARNELNCLEMEGNKIDDYIAKFENLV